MENYQNTLLSSQYKIEIWWKYNIQLKVLNNSIEELYYNYETYRWYIWRQKRKSKTLTLNDINFPNWERKEVTKVFSYDNLKSTYIESCIENIKFELLKVFWNLWLKKWQNQIKLSELSFPQAEKIYLFNVLREILRDIFLYCQRTWISIDGLNLIPNEWKFDIIK